ncbi:hypothetical protein [Agromyces bauzanensis]
MTNSTLSRVSSITALGAALLLAGCAPSNLGAERPPASAAAESAPTAASAVTPEETCTALSVPASLGFNAFNEFRKGNIDIDARNQMLVDASTAYRAVPAEPGSQLEAGIHSVIAYIDASAPSSDGALFDASTDDYANLGSTLGGLCSAAGTELVINAASGG